MKHLRQILSPFAAGAPHLLAGRCALVTGGSYGFAPTLARHPGEAGASVEIADICPEVIEFAEAAQQAGGDCRSALISYFN